MLLLLRIMLAIILAVTFQCVVGNQKIIYVSESASNEDLFSGENDEAQMCCVHAENCSCNSFDQALANLTSNVLINITTDVTLSSLVTASHLENVSIIGHNGPIVDCKNVGGVHFISFHNCTIQGIVWNGCGTENTGNYTESISTLKLSKSSNIIIQNSTFKHSIGQAVVLSEMSGEVSIRDCNFLNNIYHKDHGAIIYYEASQCFQQLQLFAISNCNFSYNDGQSLVYIANRISGCNTSNLNITFHHSNFCYNQGTCIHVVNQGLYITGEVLFEYNRAENAAGIYISDHSTVVFGENTNATFIQNCADYKGGAVYLSNHSSLIIDQDSLITFMDNSGQIGGAIYLSDYGHISFEGNSATEFSNNSAEYDGGAIYLSDYGHISFEGNSTTEFSNNSAEYDGGAIYLSDYGNISFEGTSTTVFSNNSAEYDGGAIYLSDYGHISFEGTSTTVFSNNSAEYDGGAIYLSNYRYISFKETSTATFSDNSADGYGGAIMSINYGHISFKGNSVTEFSNNSAECDGGAIYLSDYDNISFEGTSTTVFSNNSAEYDGGAIYLSGCGHISFEGNSTTVFSNNSAEYDGGAIYLSDYSHISFEGTSITEFSNNSAEYDGGAIYLSNHSYLSFKGNSTTEFSNNSAEYYGGAIYLFNHSYISFEGNSTTEFSNNSAEYDGGAIYLSNHSYISFEGNSTTEFSNNSADYGGAIYSFDRSYISFKGISNTSFISNNAEHGHGGAINCDGNDLSFKGNSTALFRKNIALEGGAMFSSHKNSVYFKEFSVVMFNDNMAIQDGGALFLTINSNVSFSKLTKVSFNNNSAINGSALVAIYDSVVCFEGHAIVTFLKNKAVRSGGAAHFSMHCIVTLTQDVNVTFENNNAIFGGAVCLNENTSISYKGNSTVIFRNNRAISDGGALSILTNSNVTVEESTRITFTTNNAQYGGAIFFDITNTTMLFNNYKTGINFTRNTARIAGNHMYFDSKGLDQNCLNGRIFGIKNETRKHYITTPPSKLEFLTPAMCISYDSKTAKCTNYYLDRIMLGEEVNIPVCLSDYCNQPSYSRQFHILPVNNQNYSITGSDQILLSCNDTFNGISITGPERLSNSFNFTINTTLNDDRSSDLKQISLNLIIQLTPCYPGFWQYPHSQKCDCYKASDVMSCSGSSSTIKRGYWFGSVTGKPTVTICPVNYCNFTCCKTSNGYYHLSPVRDNQCRSHRSGTACGSCADGYTLSFDSIECVNIDTCRAGQTTSVILLSVIYWIVMVTLVFLMMYYKVGVGYLYSIIYCYSIMDILLFQNLQASKGLYITVSIMSSFSKIIPQFLGELCLATGMSGIDQYFIHYIHPLAVILILVTISLLARKSMKISAIISRGIIHVICLLLLLSYTSIASTSLLLMRPLQFQDIDEVYTYLSPDIKYFNGRHLPYGIVAVMCTVFIAIGLPAFLVLEPFLSRKFTFTKIKPLLDQFQGCYKDKYRCFAGYYMICRLLVITTFIASSYIGFLADYLLVTICGIIATIQLMVKPYNYKTLNNLDGVILQIIVLITALPLLDDDHGSPLVITIAFVLVFLPLIIVIIMALYLHKDHLKKFVKSSRAECDPPSCSNVIHDDTALRNFDLIVDDGVRQNATICDM